MDKKKTNRDKLKEVFGIDLDKDDEFYLVQYTGTDNRYDVSTFLDDWLNAEYKDNGDERYISALKSKIKFLNILVELINDLYAESLKENQKLEKQIEQIEKGENNDKK